MSLENSPTLSDQLTALEDGTITATGLLEESLLKTRESSAKAIYTQLFEHTARAEAKAVDTLRESNAPVGPLAGLPLAIKDLFDVAGQVTRSGSKLLAKNSPAVSDAAAVQHLREAGAVIVGHTNMTEFAYSGLGLNPHYGTPTNPLDDERIPGGSSSGSAAAVARGMASAALGTDTGGSVRIPAAFCGLVGFKPTQARIPRDGMLPLSPTLDSIGPIAPSVHCCALLDAVLRGVRPKPLAPANIRGLRLLAPTSYVLDGMDDVVSRAFEQALQRLSGVGAQLDVESFAVLEQLPDLGRGGGFTAAESYHDHQEWLVRHREMYDPRVVKRIERGASMTAADYLELHRRRAELSAIVDYALMEYDALVMPTVPVVPPLFTELRDDDAYTQINQLVLRNPTIANLLGLCAISLPCHWASGSPVGLMLVGRAGTDDQLLKIAAGVEALLGSAA